MKKEQKIKSPKGLKVFLIIIGAVVTAALITIAYNHTKTDYEDLNVTDKQILSKLDAYITFLSHEASL